MEGGIVEMEGNDCKSVGEYSLKGNIAADTLE